MSELADLIRELCPNGVAYRSIGKTVKNIKKINWKETEGAQYQYIDLTSVDRETQQITDTQIITGENAPSRAQQIVHTGDILLGATRPMLKRYCMVDDEYDGQICSTGFCVLRADESIVSRRWLYHIVTSTDFFSYVDKYQKGASYPAISDNDVKQYEFPVPPLPVQREIVRILDNFTELTAEISEQLAAELAARKKQYEYYRNRLLTSPMTIERKKISQIAETFIGLATSVTQYKVTDGVQLLHNSDIQQNRIVVKTTEYVDATFAQKNKGKVLKTGDIITVHTGDVGTSAVITHEYDGSIGFTTITTRLMNPSGTLPQYVCHYFNSQCFKKEIESKTISDRNNLNLSSFDELMIPIPSVEVQKRVIRVLDNFDAICSDLNFGLPAEIEARKKQYEFYRDALLTYAATGEMMSQSRAEQSRAEQSRAEQSRAEQSRAEQNNSLIRLCQYVFGSVQIKLSDVVSHSCSGGTPAKGISAYYENGTIPWLRTQDVRFNEILEVDSYITEDAVQKTSAKWIPANCVIVAISGATAGRCAINKIAMTTNQHCLNLEIDPNRALYKYVYYVICNQYDDLIERKQGARGDLNSSLVLSLVIPLPSLAEQARIVSILDRFDTLCNDLSIGLPAEIAARQRQYEHYRDRLLTFRPIT